MTILKQQYIKRAKAIFNMLKCSSWYWNKPELRKSRSQILTCGELTNHSEANDRLCLCGHAMYD